jgi:hypothetical protein
MWWQPDNSNKMKKTLVNFQNFDYFKTFYDYQLGYFYKIKV